MTGKSHNQNNILQPQIKYVSIKTTRALAFICDIIFITIKQAPILINIMQNKI